MLVGKVSTVSTMFDLMIDFEYLWKDTMESWPSSIYGFGLGVEEKPPSVDVSTDALSESFISGFDEYGEVWEKIIQSAELSEIKKTKDMPKDEFYYPSDLWARILFSFAIAYRNNEIDKEYIIKSMIPFYHSIILSFVNKTGHMDIKECEEYFEAINRVFEGEKCYQIKRWDEDQKKLGHKLFKTNDVETESC